MTIIKKGKTAFFAALFLLLITAKTNAQFGYHLGLVAGPQFTTLNSELNSFCFIVLSLQNSW